MAKNTSKKANTDTIEKLKSDFKEWSGFDLEGDTYEELSGVITSRHWDLECELDQQKEGFEDRLKARFPDWM